MTPSQHLARIRRSWARVRVVNDMRTAALNRYAADVESARETGVPWASICRESGGQTHQSIRQKIQEARRRREKRGGS